MINDPFFPVPPGAEDRGIAAADFAFLVLLAAEIISDPQRKRSTDEHVRNANTLTHKYFEALRLGVC